MKEKLTTLALASVIAVAATALALGCSTGTPAAPEGTEIYATFDFVECNIETGDFEVLLQTRVLDTLSGVPQTGVDVLFLKTEGLGRFLPSAQSQATVRTNNDGIARILLEAESALDSASEVTVRMVSGGAEEAEISLVACGGTSPTARPPDARFTVTPDMATTGETVTVDVSGSSDPDCPGGEPDDWAVDWGDGAFSSGSFDGSTTATHSYSTAGTFTIELTVENCVGEEDTTSRSLSVN